MKENGEASVETERTEAARTTEIGAYGGLDCFIVFSDRPHVDHIYPLLSEIERVLRSKGFNPIRLGDEIRSTEDYLERLEGVVQDCALGVVVFDGFRPNVLFEFGFLKGRQKPIIVVQSKDACVCVKTLYRSSVDSGLGQRNFGRLRNPPLEPSFHFSDFAGKHVTTIDWGAREGDPLHPGSAFENELGKHSQAITEEVARVKTRHLPKLEATLLQKLLSPLKRIIECYTDAAQCDVQVLERAHAEMVSLSRQNKFVLPHDVYDLIAATYSSKASQLMISNVAEAIHCLQTAADTYREILLSSSIQDAPLVYGDTHISIGNACLQLAEYQDISENCKRAIKAYGEALKVYALEHSPMQYAMTQNNLGSAYRKLADVEAKAANCKRAIKALKEALKVYTLERFPMDYAMAQNNLGTAYGTLAEVEAKAANCKKAIEAYREGLKVRTLEHFPMQYAAMQNNLGSAYVTLAGVEAKAGNCKKAIEAYREGLKVHTLERFPMQYAVTQNNLGSAYATLADVEARAANCKKAIEAHREALKVRTLERFPMQYAATQNNLGNAYRTLADVEAKAGNCKRAIKAKREALRMVRKMQLAGAERLSKDIERLTALCKDG